MSGRRILLAVTLLVAALWVQPAEADVAFQQWLQSLWPQAQQLGISRATFDAATRGLEPDLSLPDLIVPGRAKRAEPGQPEFVQTPAGYLKQATLERLAARGRALAAEYKTALAAIEKDFGVPAAVVLAIWGRETAYGGHRLPHHALRVLATQAYLGRRKEQFREEFLYALKMLQEDHARPADLRSSWAGAMGLTQFLPSEFYRHGVDFDRDGRVDIWNSVPDALASAAKQLAAKGWQAGRRWAYEVRPPKGVDCTIAEPSRTLPVSEWLNQGYVPLGGHRPGAAELDEPASLLLPEGTYGPAFLTPKNYYVIKDYNFSDLYVLFVGNLSDRIAGGGGFVTPWSKESQLQTADVERMQTTLAALGLYSDKIDGKAGMLTRVALGAYQKANGLKVDCWPTRAVLEHMQKTERN